DFMTLLFKAAHKSVICRNIQVIRGVLEAVLPVPERARRRIFAIAKEEGQRREKRISTVDEFVEAYPELTFLIDGVEQEKRKPKDQAKRKDDYSGKKKKHTRKQIVIGTPAGIIVNQSPSVGGRSHDFKVFKEDCEKRQVIDEFAEHRTWFYGDSRFQGIDELGLAIRTRITHRGRRNHPLTRDEKKINRLRNHTRVEIKHTFSLRKKYRIAAEVYRNRDADYDQTMNIVAGLVNLRTYDRIFQKTGVKI
ncbi:MAG: transposase family protein, partial [Actinomycetota bacterium]